MQDNKKIEDFDGESFTVKGIGVTLSKNFCPSQKNYEVRSDEGKWLYKWIEDRRCYTIHSVSGKDLKTIKRKLQYRLSSDKYCFK